MNAGITKGGGRAPPDPAAGRKSSWDHAVSFSGLDQAEIAAVVGRSKSRVAHYCSARGAVPTEDIIALLEAYCRERVEREAARLGVAYADRDTLSRSPSAAMILLRAHRLRRGRIWAQTTNW